jgi:hypothetical protein
MEESVRKSKALLERWGKHPAFKAFQPVNEPWDKSDIPTLTKFYRDIRKLVQELAPQAYFVFYNTWDPAIWNDLFNDTDKVVMDHHYY